MLREKGPVQIAENIYWVGAEDPQDALQINVYLLIKKGKGVLIDPGPVPQFPDIRDALSSILPLSEISYMVVSHQDPDICASVPLWEKAGFRGKIVAHWRTALLLPAYGMESSIIRINAQNHSLPEYALQFISLPYLHSPGTMGTLDLDSGSFFSSDLFGSLAQGSSLYAKKEKYLPGMIYLHRHYMPSSILLNTTLDKLDALDLKRICPQHGSIIDSEIPAYKDALRQTRCGVLNRQASNLEEKLSTQWETVQKENLQLQESLILNQDERIRDSVTGLYNTEYFRNYLPVFLQSHPEGSIVWMRLDEMQTFNGHYGHAEGDKAIAVFARIIQENKPDDVLLFRESGPQLILLLPGEDAQKNRQIVSLLQKEIRDSEDFIQSMTCSLAMIASKEVLAGIIPQDELKKLLRDRMNSLEKMGPDSLSDKENEEWVRSIKPVLFLLEPDRTSGRYIQDYFQHRGFELILCSKGKEALRKVDIHRPSVIISEIQIPQIDGFRIRKSLLESEDLRSIPFLFMCRRKTEAIMQRALKLKVPLVLEKPLMLPELQGWIDFLTEGGSIRGD